MLQRFRPYFRYLQPHRGLLNLAILCGIIAGIASGFGLPYMVKQVFPVIFAENGEIGVGGGRWCLGRKQPVLEGEPGGDSWGGTFVKTGHGPNFWTDDSNPLYKLGTYNGAAYVREHQQQIYNDFYKQLDKAKAGKDLSQLGVWVGDTMRIPLRLPAGAPPGLPAETA